MNVLSTDHCILDSYYHGNYENRVIVMNPDVLKPQYRNEQGQLWLGGSGFGCDPSLNGRAVNATCLFDGEHAEWRRENFLGVIDPEALPEWARIKLGSMSLHRTYSTYEYVGYSFLPDGMHGPGVHLRDVKSVAEYVELQSIYQHRVMICDAMDCCVLEIQERTLIFPSSDEARGLSNFLESLEDNGGIKMT